MIKKKCCPLFTILTIIFVLAAVMVTVYLILNKLHMLERYLNLSGENEWPEEPAEKEAGVPYTTDQDFVRG